MRISINAAPDEKDEFLADIDYREARLCEDYILINQDLEDSIFFADRVLTSLRKLGQSRPVDEGFSLTQEESRAYAVSYTHL